ncbi:MAG: GTP-binding protein [Acidimicrobiia bacterium]|nr:GTP-binding protein [Acidimicrobiia bacterium]
MPTETAGPAADVGTPVHHEIPLTILTGFLGAGKTTLLNHLLTADHGLRIAVLVNDFGSINIDAELVVGVEENMMSLANGCVCCEIRDDLIEAVEQLVTLEVPPEHLVLEASGVADPASIWATFAGSQHPEWLRLDGVTCVVDCDQIFRNLDEEQDLLMLKARQIAFADLVVLNKVDLAGPDMLAWIRQWIDTMMDKVRIVEAVRGEVPLDVLLGAGRDPASSADSEQHHDHDHGSRFSTWTYETDRVFDEAVLREMIRKDLPGSVYRCKGFAWVEGSDGLQRMVLQSVARRCELTSAPPSGPEGARSRIVAIGTADLDEVELRRAFDGCLVAD